jgi:hypothetical protein
LELDVLETAGPRIIRLRSRLMGLENILAEVPNMHIPTALGDYYVLGGHRLQTAPETSPSTYIPDGKPVLINQTTEGIEIFGQTEPETGLSRGISVQFHEDHERLTVRHDFKNESEVTLEISAWSLTMLPPGGRIFMPLRLSTSKPSNVLPDCSLVFWPYSRLDTSVFSLTKKTAVLVPSTDHLPFKFGGLASWLAYEFNNLVFMKTFSVDSEQPYPDRGCSAEAYANDDFVELESLSPLKQVEPGQTIHHIEEWEILTNAAFSEFLTNQK